MNADDRILMLDLENLGMPRLRPRMLRARLGALLAAAGKIHHAVAAYSLSDGLDGDSLASMLAELRIAPMPVPPGADAAELALLAHARYVHAAGGRIFLVGSADGRFAQLATLGRVEVLVWDGQPVATRLAEVAHDLRRIARRTATPTGNATEQQEPSNATKQQAAGNATKQQEPSNPTKQQATSNATKQDEPGDAIEQDEPEADGIAAATATATRPCRNELAVRLLAAVATGVAIALTNAVTDRLLRRSRRS